MSTPTMIGSAGPGVESGPDRGPLLLDEHFAPVPEWVLDSPISDCALRLYAVLLRYGQTSGARIPSRATLARRLHKASTDTVDRAMRELVTLGAVTVQHRHTDGAHQTNRYHLRTRRPTHGRTPATPGARPNQDQDGDRETAAGRTRAATPPVSTPASTPGLSHLLPGTATPSATVAPGGRKGAAPGPTRTARVAAGVRPDPEPFTQQPPPPTPPRTAARTREQPEEEQPREEPGEQLAPLEQARATALAHRLGLTGAAELHLLTTRCRQHRAATSLPVGRWTDRAVLAALHLALQRGHPPLAAPNALRAVATDPDTRSPMPDFRR